MPRSGITYNDRLAGVFAAVWANYTWSEFQALEGEEQAFVIAAYASKLQIDAVIAEEQRKFNEAKKPKKYGRR